MAEINYIRYETNTKGKSYSSVAKQMNRDRRTIKKYAEQDEVQIQQPFKQKRKARVMDPVKPIIDQWIREDMKKKKKFQRTAKRMYDLLVEQHQFTGSDRSVRAYVAKRRQELLEENQAAYLPLESRAGTAQVDFGEAPFLYEGKEVVRPYLVLSFPYSNSFLFQVFPSQNRECFLQGLANMFSELQGVPHTIRFDNLSPAVKKVLPHGERELTDEFQRFVSHYGFQYEFCNPNSGHEKGHVESMVKYIRNNYLLPAVSYHDFQSLHELTIQWSIENRQREHYEKNLPIAELYLADQEKFLQLPGKPFECVRFLSLKADKYGFIQIEQKKYSTSPRYARQVVIAKVGYDHIILFNEEQIEIVKHKRLYGDEEMKSMNWQPYLHMMAKRPNALKYSSFYDDLSEKWKNYLQDCTISEKKAALSLLSNLLKERDFTLADQALDVASAHGHHPTAAAIEQVFYQLVNGRGIRETLPNSHLSVTIPPSAERGLDHYDQLFAIQGGGTK